jgi:hypothetical protein
MKGKRSNFEEYFDSVPIHNPYWRTGVEKDADFASKFNGTGTNDKSNSND